MDPGVLQLINSLGQAFIVMLGGALTLYIRTRFADAARERVLSDQKVADLGAKVEVVHRATNSIVSQLVAAAKQEAYAAGQKEQKENPSGGSR